MHLPSGPADKLSSLLRIERGGCVTDEFPQFEQ